MIKKLKLNRLVKCNIIRKIIIICNKVLIVAKIYKVVFYTNKETKAKSNNRRVIKMKLINKKPLIIFYFRTKYLNFS